MHRYDDWHMDAVAADDGMPVRDHDDTLDPAAYDKPGEGDWVQLSFPPYRCFDSCCDCGLVHEWEYKLEPCTDDPSEMTLWRRGWRRPKRTATARKTMQNTFPRVEFTELEGWQCAVVLIPIEKLEPPTEGQ